MDARAVRDGGSSTRDGNLADRTHDSNMATLDIIPLVGYQILYHIL